MKMMFDKPLFFQSDFYLECLPYGERKRIMAETIAKNRQEEKKQIRYGFLNTVEKYVPNAVCFCNDAETAEELTEILNYGIKYMKKIKKRC
jgi:hypothetical protein